MVGSEGGDAFYCIGPQVPTLQENWTFLLFLCNIFLPEYPGFQYLVLEFGQDTNGLLENVTPLLIYYHDLT